MTYLLGLLMPFGAAIVADRRLTALGSGEGRDSGLKTGRLSDGTIFGLAGALSPARELLNNLRLAWDRHGDELEGWERAVRVLEAASSTSERERFTLVLGRSHDGDGRLTVYDSVTGISHLFGSGDAGIYTFGSGKDLLDPMVRSSIWPSVEQILTAQDDSVWIAPYTVAFRLTCLTRGFAQSTLNAAGVGGGCSTSS